MSESKSYAVVVSGGKQYRVSPGQKLKVAKLEAEAGKSVQFDRVLLVGEIGGEVKIGTPDVAGAKISAKVVRHGRGKKLIVFKKRRRKGYTKKQGHRQDFTELLVEKL